MANDTFQMDPQSPIVPVFSSSPISWHPQHYDVFSQLFKHRVINPKIIHAGDYVVFYKDIANLYQIFKNIHGIGLRQIECHAAFVSRVDIKYRKTVPGPATGLSVWVTAHEQRLVFELKLSGMSPDTPGQGRKSGQRLHSYDLCS